MKEYSFEAIKATGAVFTEKTGIKLVSVKGGKGENVLTANCGGKGDEKFEVWIDERARVVVWIGPKNSMYSRFSEAGLNCSGREHEFVAAADAATRPAVYTGRKGHKRFTYSDVSAAVYDFLRAKEVAARERKMAAIEAAAAETAAKQAADKEKTKAADKAAETAAAAV